MSKIFITGLPRTGTTSVSVALLDLGYRVAHTALTQKSIDTAEVIADTPAFCHYQELDRHFPESKFIHLERKPESWLPSIKSLLENMATGLSMPQGGFHPVVKQCYLNIFGVLTPQTIPSNHHLENCYNKHSQQVSKYFSDRPKDFLSIDISEADAYKKMINFLGIQSEQNCFPRLNASGKIVSWQQLQHKNKVPKNL